MSTKIKKKLYKSKEKILSGVVGGIGEYFDIDATVARVVYIILMIFSGVLPLLVIYVLLTLIVPEHPHNTAIVKDKTNG
jgi:phage shock protein C